MMEYAIVILFFVFLGVMTWLKDKYYNEGKTEEYEPPLFLCDRFGVDPVELKIHHLDKW